MRQNKKIDGPGTTLIICPDLMGLKRARDNGARGNFSFLFLSREFSSHVRLHNHLTVILILSGQHRAHFLGSENLPSFSGA